MWAKNLRIEPEIANSVGMKFRLIPPGQFDMGSEAGDENEKPVRRVTISRPFYMDIHECTQKAYHELMGANPSGLIGDNRPVEMVSGEDAAAFCKKLSEKEGKTYRLPTEAEWEWACRGGTKTAWSFGDEQSRVGDYAWTQENSPKQTQPVGQKKPNPYGLFDMHGNVWEFCSDWIAPYPTGAASDPSGPNLGQFRAFRGGSYFFPAWESRSSNRPDRAFPPKGTNLGFRVVREVSPAAVPPLAPFEIAPAPRPRP